MKLRRTYKAHDCALACNILSAIRYIVAGLQSNNSEIAEAGAISLFISVSQPPLSVFYCFLPIGEVKLRLFTAGFKSLTCK